MEPLEIKEIKSPSRSTVFLAGLLIGIVFSLCTLCWRAMLPWVIPSVQESTAPIVCLLGWSSVGLVYFGKRSSRKRPFPLLAHLALAVSIISASILLNAKRALDIVLWSNHALPDWISGTIAWLLLVLGLAVPGLLFGVSLAVIAAIESGDGGRRLILPSSFLTGLMIGTVAWNLLRTRLGLDLIPLVAILPAIAAGFLTYRGPIAKTTAMVNPTPKATKFISFLEILLACFLATALILLWLKFLLQTIYISNGMYVSIVTMIGLAIGLLTRKEYSNAKILIGYIFGCASIFLILLYLWQPSAIALMPISQSQTRSVWLDFLIWMVLSFPPAFLTGGLVASVLLKGKSKQKALAPTGIAAVLIGVALATEVNSFLPSDTIKYPLIMLITPFIFFLLALREIYINRKDPILTTMVGICIILTAIIAIKAPRWDRFLASGFSKYGAYQPSKSKLYDGRVPLYRESANGVLAVLREEHKTHLAIGGKITLSMPDDFALRVVAAHLPFLFHWSPERALIIGDPALVIAGAVAGHSMQQITCVEQQDSRQIGQWFRYYNRDVGMDQRLLISAKIPHKKFDVIVVDVAGGLPLLHSDLSLLSSCVLLGQSIGHLLTDDGIVAFVIPIQGINQDQLLLVISAIASIFPEKSLWLVEPSGVILLASQKPLEIDLEGLEKEFSRYEIRKSLESIGISEPFDLLRFHSSSGSEIVALKTGIPETTIENSEVLWSKYSRSEPSRVSIMRMLLSNSREKANLAFSIDQRERFVETIELAERGKHIAATRLLEDLSKQNPENGYYRYCLSNYLTVIARDLRLRNQGSAARSASIMAIEMLNNNPTAYYEAALSESDSPLAVSLLDKALSINPDYYHAYVAKARLQMTNGDPRSALETLGALMASEPLNLEIGYLRAMALIESGQISSARMLLEQIVRRGLQSDEVMEALAYTLLVEGNLGKALDSYKILIKSRPDDPGILNNYATLLAEQGRLKKALKIWKRALKLDPNNRDIRANIEEVEAKIRGQSP